MVIGALRPEVVPVELCNIADWMLYPTGYLSEICWLVLSGMTLRWCIDGTSGQKYQVRLLTWTFFTQLKFKKITQTTNRKI